MSHNRTNKQTVSWLLHHAAIKMMSESPLKTKARESAQSLYNQLRAHESTEVVAGVAELGNIVTGLVRALVHCEDPAQLGRVAEYIKAIEKGEVQIMEPEQITPQAPATE